MNDHWTLFYYSAAFVLGIFSAGLATVTYLKTKAAVVRAYLWFYVTLTVTLGSDVLVAYTETNLPAEAEPGLIGLFFVNIATTSLLIWTFPMFVHALYELPSRQRRNRIAAGMAGVSYLGMHGVIWFAESQGTAASGFFALSELMLVGAIGYGVWVSVRQYWRVRATPERNMAGALVAVFVILAGVALEDEILGIVADVWLYPLVYAGFGAFFSWYFLKLYGPHPAPATQSQHPPTPSPLPEIIPRSEDIASGLATDSETFCAQYQISPREHDVLRLALQGCTNTQIADALFISANTVKTHLSSIYGKIGVNRRYDLIARCSHLRLSTPPDDPD